MTSIKVRGVNRVGAEGKVYYYHRATGTRIQSDPRDAAAFAEKRDRWLANMVVSVLEKDGAQGRNRISTLSN